MKLFLLNGFLGSGKTTAIQQSCLLLMRKGTQVGAITNDQGIQLVDSAFMKSSGITTREVVKGCFCCNYVQLEAGIQSLAQDIKPEFLFAESVGSCTDITATIVKPLQKFHPEMGVVLSVFADAALLLKAINDETVPFDGDVNYIYENQLKEADILIVNKVDLINGEQKEIISEKMRKRFPDKIILFQNSLEQDDIQKWLDALMNFDSKRIRPSLPINYDQYGSGEAKLAWLDAEIEISSGTGDALDATISLINRMFRKVQTCQYPIGHLKFFLQSGEWKRKISFTSLNEQAIKQTRSVIRHERIDLLINVRVQTVPNELTRILSGAMREVPSVYILKNKYFQAFQPGFPSPTYRLQE